MLALQLAAVNTRCKVKMLERNNCALLRQNDCLLLTTFYTILILLS